MKNQFIYTMLLMAFSMFFVGMFYPFTDENKIYLFILCSIVTGLISVILFIDVGDGKK